MDTDKQVTIDVRNALFDLAHGKPFGPVMMGVLMAQGKLTAATCGGDVGKIAAVLTEYFQILMEAVPIYCAEVEAGNPNTMKN